MHFSILPDLWKPLFLFFPGSVLFWQLLSPTLSFFRSPTSSHPHPGAAAPPALCPPCETGINCLQSQPAVFLQNTACLLHTLISALNVPHASLNPPSNGILYHTSCLLNISWICEAWKLKWARIQLSVQPALYYLAWDKEFSICCENDYIYISSYIWY